MEETGEGSGLQKITLNNRKNAFITGVQDVISFDEHLVQLQTRQGNLSVKGEQLHVNRLSLDKGEVDLQGRVDAMIYSGSTAAAAKQDSLLAKLFR